MTNDIAGMFIANLVSVVSQLGLFTPTKVNLTFTKHLYRLLGKALNEACGIM